MYLCLSFAWFACSWLHSVYVYSGLFRLVCHFLLCLNFCGILRCTYYGSRAAARLKIHSTYRSLPASRTPGVPLDLLKQSTVAITSYASK